MNDNLYAPPKVDLFKHEDASHGDSNFYVVSQTKFAVLFLVTVGMYQVFWFFKNWSCYKQQCIREDSGDRTIWPVPRAIFAVFFVHALFREIVAHAAAKSRLLVWDAEKQATTLVLLLIASSVLSRLSQKSIGSPFTDIASLLVLIVMYYSCRGAQEAINISCGDPQGESNSKFTWANYVWIVLGSVVWLGVIVGLFLPDEAA